MNIIKLVLMPGRMPGYISTTDSDYSYTHSMFGAQSGYTLDLLYNVEVVSGMRDRFVISV